jgi:hypothetical protein
MNSATDNPMVFRNPGRTLSAGNFHGEYPAKAMDYLAIGIHEIANMSEVPHFLPLLLPWFTHWIEASREIGQFSFKWTSSIFGKGRRIQFRIYDGTRNSSCFGKRE